MPTVKELRTQLGKRGLPTDSRKAELRQRLVEAERQDSTRARTAVNSMPTAKELRTQLGKRGLPTDGRKPELEQRLVEAERQDSKRARPTVNSVADEWLCPITRELPSDPVTAEDGHIYERAAIVQWTRKERRSPITGAAMGKRLLPAPKVRNTIEKLVESGLIDADRAAAWKTKMKQERSVIEMRRKADHGDTEAMYKLGLWHAKGVKGLAKDHKQARH